MFRFTEPSSGQFLKQNTFNECTLWDLILFKGHFDTENHVKFCWSIYYLKLYKNSCQYIVIKICEIMLAYIFMYIRSNLKGLVRWSCLHMVDSNIVSYWLCSKFWRTFNKDILAVLCKAKFQVVYHMLILLF